MILELFKLNGKVAVVTGSGRGIGQAYAIGLAEAGADIALVDVISMDETAEKIRALGRRENDGRRKEKTADKMSRRNAFTDAWTYNALSGHCK